MSPPHPFHAPLRRALPGVGLALILALYLLYASSWWSIDGFGRAHDDTVYFSSARSLAEGRGYTLPSVPGRPAQTKYPVLYAWVLSWVWRLHPAFPANVLDAQRVTSLWGCLFLALAFVFLRRRAGGAVALGIVALCAFHPIFGTQSTNLYSDAPFMALALASCIAAEAALQPAGRPALLALAAALAGLAFLTRSLGLAVVAGIAAAALQRRLFRRAAVFTVGVAPFVLGWFGWVAVHRPPLASGAAGWRQTLAYYTSYPEFWRLSVPDAGVLWTLLKLNVEDILSTPGVLCLFPPPGWPGAYLSVVLCTCFSAWIVAGVWRESRTHGGGPFHLALVFTTAIILFWNFAIAQSYLMLFLPLFYLGLWQEAGHLLRMIRDVWRRGRPAAERALAGALATALAATAFYSARHYAVGFRPAYRVWQAERAAVAADRQAAYAWIRERTPPETRLLAYEDANLYLHTGRQAAWLLAFTNGAFYSRDPQVMTRELAMLPDVARQIGARYWLFVEGDFYRESGSERVRERIAAWRRELPVVYRSPRGQAEIHDLACVLEPQQEACRAVVAALRLGPPESRVASGSLPRLHSH